MTSVSKYVYIDKLDKIVNQYNNTYYNAMKIKPVDVKPGSYIDFGQKIMRKILNLKLVTM